MSVLANAPSHAALIEWQLQVHDGPSINRRKRYFAEIQIRAGHRNATLSPHNQKLNTTRPLNQTSGTKRPEKPLIERQFPMIERNQP
jgi:hypothetical protein